MPFLGLAFASTIKKARNLAFRLAAERIIDAIRDRFPKLSSRAHPNVDAIVNLIATEFLGKTNEPVKIAEIAKVIKKQRAPRKTRTAKADVVAIDAPPSNLPPVA